MQFHAPAQSGGCEPLALNPDSPVTLVRAALQCEFHLNTFHVVGRWLIDRWRLAYRLGSGKVYIEESEKKQIGP